MSAIKAKGRTSNRVVQENKSRQIFRKMKISYLLIRTRTCPYQGVRNIRLLACFVFLWHPFWDSPFYRFTDVSLNWTFPTPLEYLCYGILPGNSFWLFLFSWISWFCFVKKQAVRLSDRRACSSCFMHAIIARMRLSFFKIFSNFVHFCPNFQIFCPFFALFLKNRTHALSF